MPTTYFFDFDDTLYSHTAGKVQESTKRCLKELLDCGERVIIATGRGAESVEMICFETEITPSVMIVMNGQIVIENGRIVFENHIALPSMASIIDIAKRERHAYGGYYAEGILANADTERVRKVWKDFSAPMPSIIPDFVNNYPLYQGNLYITREEAAIYGSYLSDYILNWSHSFMVNLIPKDAGKSQAMRWCFKQYNIDHEKAFAFGDGFNDADMLQVVGHPIAMGNATPELKEIAEYVTGTVDENGIYQALKHYGLVGFAL